MGNGDLLIKNKNRKGGNAKFFLWQSANDSNREGDGMEKRLRFMVEVRIPYEVTLNADTFAHYGTSDINAIKDEWTEVIKNWTAQDVAYWIERDPGACGMKVHFLGADNI